MSKDPVEKICHAVQLNLSRLEIVNNHPILWRTWRQGGTVAIRRNGWWR